MYICIMKSGIYKISFDNNRLFYIGSAVDLMKRKSNHIYELNRNNHCNNKIQNAYNKHGMFHFEVLENCTINYLDTLCPNLNILKIAFSSLGYKHKKETINFLKKDAKIKAECKDWRDKVSKGWFKKGQKVEQSKESIQKRVNKFRGYKHT